MAKKILLIEDEQYLVDMYTTKFEIEGFKVIIAENGVDGIAAAKKEKPDLILLDLILPKTDGYEVLAALRADEATKNSLICIFSNLGQGTEVEQGLAAGADGYFVKSNLTPTQLVNKVKKIFEGGNDRGEIVTPKGVTISKGDRDGAVTPRKTSKHSYKDNGNSARVGLRILVMEDEEPILRMYQDKLEDEGMVVTGSLNGAWGLNAAKHKKFDIIIMDMNMPAMNGFKALEEIKKSELNKNTPVMVVSNSAQDAEISKAKKLGADCFLLKSSITPSRLVKEIKKRYPSRNT